MNIPRIACLLLLPLLTACVSGLRQQSSLVSYDLPGSPPELAAPLRSLDVTTSSWLAGNAMYYRLAYVDGSRREHFAESRWTAQPEELLAVRLQRSLMGADSLKGENFCRLRLDLDDLVQVLLDLRLCDVHRRELIEHLVRDRIERTGHAGAQGHLTGDGEMACARLLR